MECSCKRCCIAKLHAGKARLLIADACFRTRSRTTEVSEDMWCHQLMRHAGPMMTSTRTVHKELPCVRLQTRLPSKAGSAEPKERGRLAVPETNQKMHPGQIRQRRSTGIDADVWQGVEHCPAAFLRRNQDAQQDGLVQAGWQAGEFSSAQHETFTSASFHMIKTTHKTRWLQTTSTGNDKDEPTPHTSTQPQITKSSGDAERTHTPAGIYLGRARGRMNKIRDHPPPDTHAPMHTSFPTFAPAAQVLSGSLVQPPFTAPAQCAQMPGPEKRTSHTTEPTAWQRIAPCRVSGGGRGRPPPGRDASTTCSYLIPSAGWCFGGRTGHCRVQDPANGL